MPHKIEDSAAIISTIEHYSLFTDLNYLYIWNGRTPRSTPQTYKKIELCVA